MNKILQDNIKAIRAMIDGPYGKQLWDVLTCLRGPDSPSEKGHGGGAENAKNYEARVTRKMKTVAIIRGKTFPGVASAKYDTSKDYVVLPPPDQWDHFDKHVQRAADALGLKVIYDGQQPPKSAPMPATGTITLDSLTAAAEDWLATKWPAGQEKVAHLKGSKETDILFGVEKKPEPPKADPTIDWNITWDPSNPLTPPSTPAKMPAYDVKTTFLVRMRQMYGARIARTFMMMQFKEGEVIPQGWMDATNTSTMLKAGKSPKRFNIPFVTPVVNEFFAKIQTQWDLGNTWPPSLAGYLNDPSWSKEKVVSW